MPNNNNATDEPQQAPSLSKAARRRRRRNMKQAGQDEILNSYGGHIMAYETDEEPVAETPRNTISKSPQGDEDQGSAVDEPELRAKEKTQVENLPQGDESSQEEFFTPVTADSLEEDEVDDSADLFDQKQQEQADTPARTLGGASQPEAKSSLSIEKNESVEPSNPSSTTFEPAPGLGDHTVTIWPPPSSQTPMVILVDVDTQLKESGNPDSVSQPQQPEELDSNSPPELVEQSLDDLFVMIRQQREALLLGPAVTVFVGDTVITDIPKRAAMAASSILNRHFTENPDSSEWHIRKNLNVNPGAVRILLVSWMRETCVEFEAFAVPYQPTIEEDLAVQHASHVLGMAKYTDPMRDEYIEYFRTTIPSYEEVVIVEENTRGSKDRVWMSMVSHLCHVRHRKEIPDPEDFKAFLQGHSRLKDAMKETDAFFMEQARRKRTEGHNGSLQQGRRRTARTRRRLGD